MCWVAKVDMELLAEFTASCSPQYKHGTPAGVQHSKCPSSSHKDNLCAPLRLRGFVARSPQHSNTTNHLIMCGMRQRVGAGGVQDSKLVIRDFLLRLVSG